MLIDTHAHLWWPTFAGDLDAVVERAKAAGVEKIIAPGTDLQTSKQAVELAKKYPSTIYAAVGIHPEEVLSSLQDSPGLAKARLNISAGSRDSHSGRVLRTMIRDNRDYIIAIGEIGTDANTEELRKKMNKQKELFRAQLEVAAEFDLPVIVHTRNSFAETIEVLDTLPSMPRGQFHCFSNDEADLVATLSRGFFVSFCGNISWSKRVRKLVPLVPSNRLLLETDSPFMLPRFPPPFALPSYRGVNNEPKNVRMLAQLQAELRGVSLKELEEYTTKNATQLYKL